MEQRVGIVTECVCDLPKKLLRQNDIRIIYFLVKTSRGSFYDTDEITARNVFECIQEQGQMPTSKEPEPEVYRQTYEQALETYDELIHIAISSRTSQSYAVALQAVSSMGETGKRIHVFDSGHLSTGQGHLVLMAARMARSGRTAEEILAELENGRERVSTSFIVENVDFLYYNGRLSEKVKNICDRFALHPVLSMKNGELTLKTILAGNYDKACKKYIGRMLKKADRIDSRRIFLTHAGCSVETLEQLKAEIKRYCSPEELLVTEASATVSSNCGPNAFGVLFLEKEEQK